MFITEEQKEILVAEGHKVTTAAELGIQTLENFADAVRERLGFPAENVKCVIQDIWTDVSKVNRRGRFMEKKTQCATFNMKNDCYHLSLIQHNSQCVEVYWIQVFDKCKGLGTEIMNHILDIADEQGIDVRAIPSDFDNPTKDPRVLVKLRDWYRSFGFVAGKLQKEVFVYKCQTA